MDIDEARQRFNEPRLSRAVQAQPADAVNNRPAVQAAAAVSLLAIRSEPLGPDPLGTTEASRNNYGPMSNLTFFNNVFQVDATFKQLVVYNSNVGLFRGHITAVITAKMIQLMSMARLGRRNLLPTQASAKASYYQSLALAEGLGPHVPDEWRLNEAQSRAEIIEAVKWILTEVGAEAAGIEDDDWFDAEIIGVPEDIRENNNHMNIHQAMALLEAMAMLLPTNIMWLNGISYVTTAISALCRRGQMTDEHREKIINGVKEATSATQVALPGMTAKRFYSMYCTGVDATNAQAVMNHYNTLIPADVIALRNVILQSSGSGLTTYMTILRAMTSFNDFPWGVVATLVPTDMGNLEVAIRTVGHNVYFGFNRQMTAVAASKYPSLAYTSFQLCIKVSGDRPLANYGGMPKVVPMKQNLDQLINNYIDRRTQAMENAVVPPEVEALTRERTTAATTAYAGMQGQVQPENANQ